MFVRDVHPGIGLSKQYSHRPEPLQNLHARFPLHREHSSFKRPKSHRVKLRPLQSVQFPLPWQRMQTPFLHVQTQKMSSSFHWSSTFTTRKRVAPKSYRTIAFSTSAMTRAGLSSITLYVSGTGTCCDATFVSDRVRFSCSRRFSAVVPCTSMNCALLVGGDT